MEETGSRGSDLVSKATRRAFREFAPGIVMREIDGMWQDEGFALGPPNQEPGDRRSLYQQYMDGVDWTDPSQVRRALRVFAVTIDGVDEQYAAGPLRSLKRDGFTFDADGNPQGTRLIALRPELLSDIRSADVIRDHLARIERAVADDPAQVIGSAKELVESTAKIILRERGVEFADDEKIPQLVPRAQEALGVHPTSISGGVDGAQATKKILGGLTAVVVGIAELRNRGYGTGHGGAEVRKGLYPRHAHLAVSAARTWCEFMLDTLQDPAAPWRRLL